MKNPKTLAIVAGALVLIAVGFLFFRGPKPIIEIKAETLYTVGTLPVVGDVNIVNTWVTSTLVMVVLIALAWFATRKLTIVPRGIQNAAEGVVGAMYDICITTAGEKNGRRFFPVIMTIFTFIWIANWMALLPFFNAIGSVEEVSAHEFHEEAAIFSSAGPLSFIKPNSSEIEFEPDEGQIAAIEDQIKIAEADGAGEEAIAALEDDKEAVYAAAILEALHKDEIVEADTYEGALAELEDEGKQLGILIPYFRSMNTDINSPLSIAVMAMIFIEFWGITTLGVFKYAGKFFNVSSPIAFFVGILEFIAEIARIISFTFRLFGNMLAGEILLLVMTFLVPFLIAIPFYGLEVFVGLIQAFVFAMLTLVFAVLAVSSHEGHDEPGGHDEDRPMEGPVPVPHQ